MGIQLIPDKMDKLYHSLTPEQQIEDRKLRTLQTIVDAAGRKIVADCLSKKEAEEVAEQTRWDRTIPQETTKFRKWCQLRASL